MHQCPDPSGHSVLGSGTMLNHKDHGGDQATTSRVLGDTIVEHPHTFQRYAERRILRGAWHRIVRRLRKKRQIARRGPPEQRRARTDGQVKTQQVSSKKWAKCISHFPADQTHSLPPCVAQVYWRALELQVCRCKESGETDHVVVHNKNMKFQDGTRSKQSEHACWMDRLKLGWMS